MIYNDSISFTVNVFQIFIYSLVVNEYDICEEYKINIEMSM